MSELLDMLNEGTRPENLSPAEQDALQAAHIYWDKVQAAFSRQFVDDMGNAVDRAWAIECEEHFARGFRLGAQLMLEIIPRPVSTLPPQR